MFLVTSENMGLCLYILLIFAENCLEVIKEVEGVVLNRVRSNQVQTWVNNLSANRYSQKIAIRPSFKVEYAFEQQSMICLEINLNYTVKLVPKQFVFHFKAKIDLQALTLARPTSNHPAWF